MKKIIFILCTIILGFAFNSCKKADSNPTSTYTIRMTDAPGLYSAVFIDLQDVEITGSNGKTVLLNVNKGIYNLLNFSNGLDTIIASGGLEATTVEQIRLILGANNSVVVDNITYPLSTPSAEQSGLKLQVHQVLQAGVSYSILLDFDANKSIVLVGSGNYKLKPVVRTIESATSGSIKGRISPAGTLTYVTATSADSYSTNVSETGDFLLMGLPAGVYTITLTPAFPFDIVTKTNITVINGITSDIGTIFL